jgi:serine/threonine-protein kinase
VKPGSLVGSRVAGRFEITGLLGSGGMAHVYRGVDRLLQREVAVKILTEASEVIRRRFLFEARSLARLNHPGIVAIYDAGEDGDISYIVMELAEGTTLREAGAGASAEFAVRATVEVLAALQYAHERDVLHRDVKPSNILVRSDGSVKVMDFGLARRISDVSAGTHPGEIAGTISYLPPERFLGKPSDARSDVYSLGIVLYELLTGTVPFRNDSDDVVAEVFAHVNERALPPTARNAHLTPELERIVLTSIEKDPAARYQSAREFAAALKAFLALDPFAQGQPR